MKGYYSGLQLASGIGTLGYNYYNNVYGNASTASRKGDSTTVRVKRTSTNMPVSSRYARTRRVAGRYKRLTAKNAHRRLDKEGTTQIQRWFNVSRFGVGPGAQGLYTYKDATHVYQPMHIMDLTAYPNNPSIGAVAKGMYCVRNEISSGNPTYTLLQSMNDAGSLGAGAWVNEYGAVAGGAVVDQARLKWCDIRLNLYGSYEIPIKYKIMIVGIHDEKSVPGITGNTDREANLIDHLLKPMKYSNLLCNTGYTSKSFHVIKQFNYTINPLDHYDSSTVVSGDTYRAPNMMEFKFFYKMDRDCDYIWHDTTSIANATADTANVNTMQTVMADAHDVVYPSKRIFLIVMASSTYQDTTSSPVSVAQPPYAQTKYVGSYDVNIRRKWQLAS